MATPNEAKFADAWRALDEESTKPGWQTLPIATSSNSLLLAGRQHPRNQESMLIGFTVAGFPKQTSLPQGKGFIVETVELPFQGVRYFCLAITRQPSASLEIFSAMLDDIVTVLERSSGSELNRIATVVDRISGWQRFMSRDEEGLLSTEAELGLLGELQVLRSLISAGIPADNAVTWWQGPTDSLHDFVCPRGHIEVKSSTKGGAFCANISTLDQLDESVVQPLYLAAVQFSLSGAGLRLPQHIDSIRPLIGTDPAVIISFEGKLLSAEEFPRLTKGSVRTGVLDATYRIEIDTAKFASFTLHDILQRIG